MRGNLKFLNRFHCLLILNWISCYNWYIYEILGANIFIRLNAWFHDRKYSSEEDYSIISTLFSNRDCWSVNSHVRFTTLLFVTLRWNEIIANRAVSFHDVYSLTCSTSCTRLWNTVVSRGDRNGSLIDRFGGFAAFSKESHPLQSGRCGILQWWFFPRRTLHGSRGRMEIRFPIFLFCLGLAPRWLHIANLMNYVR